MKGEEESADEEGSRGNFLVEGAKGTKEGHKGTV